ncbi:MAG: glycerol-3-phosphate 1-O-acyltransferase PlsY [Clostridiales bacterium]|nr:glycerol-3-phosphate 1-O-acyltransferase PlsY [Clostridiales bacterium]
MYSELGVTGLGMSSVAVTVIVCALAYLLGNISPSILLGKAKGIDIRKEGSGNPGTTNTLRVMGKKAAVIVLLVDILKGTLAVVLAGVLFGQHMAMYCTLLVFCGHVWPVLFGMRGGKGVATAFGALTGLCPPLGLGCLAVVLIAVAITRYVSFGSIFGALACPILSVFLIRPFLPYAAIMAAIVIWRHRSNIGRLMRHEESKLSFHSAGKKETAEEKAAQD